MPDTMKEKIPPGDRRGAESAVVRQYYEHWSHFGVVSNLRSALRKQLRKQGDPDVLRMEVAKLKTEANVCESRYVAYCLKSGAHEVQHQHGCARWLLGKRCLEHRSEGCPDCMYKAPRGCWDHASAWARGGKPYALLSQQYVEGPIPAEIWAPFVEWCKARGITATQRPGESWYFETGVMLIELRPTWAGGQR